MPRFRVSYAFNASQDRVSGWTENFWNVNDSISGAIDAALALRPLLKALHGAQSVNKRCRISSDEGPRTVRPLRFADAAPAPNGVNESDQSMQALLLELYGNPEGLTRQWIKGIPDGQVRKGGIMDLNGDYIPAFQAFKAELIKPASGWSVRLVVDENPFQHIDGISETGVLTVPGHGLAGTNKVMIKGFKTPLFVNGVRKVLTVSPDTLRILNYIPAPGVAYTGDGFIRLHEFETFGIADCALVFATSKRVGRPTAVVTGRRSKRRR